MNEDVKELLKKRYCRGDEETWEDIVNRMMNAEGVTSGLIERDVDPDAIRNLLLDRKFLPNSPTIMNLGAGTGQLSACFVIPINDTIESIYESLKDAAIIFKSGGGVGFNFSNLRPEGSLVGSSGGKSTGPVAFMEDFNTMAETVKQGGTRRGAMMACMRVDHPDIVKFIHCKEDKSKLNNMNISVIVTDDFMEKVKFLDDVPDANYKLTFDGVEYGSLFVKDVWDMLTYAAADGAEPGILFEKVFETEGKLPIVGTNPCFRGNQPLLTKEEGYVPIGSKNGEMVTVWNGHEWSKVAVFSTGVNRLYRVTLSDGIEIDVTGYHWWPVVEFNKTSGRWSDVEKVLTVDLKPGMKLEEYPLPGKDATERTQIVSVTDLGIEEETFCVNEPKRHMVTVNNHTLFNCGEQPLPAYGSCNLGSIDVSKYVESYFETGAYALNYSRLREDAVDCALYLDTLIDINKFPLHQIEEVAKKERRIGLGIMGLADALMKLGIPYDSDLGIGTAQAIMRSVHEAAKGVLPDASAVTTIAPTGTLSMIAECSSGCEPVFALEYTKTVMDGTEFKYVNPIYEQFKNAYDPAVFKTAQELSVEAHIKMQAALQQFVDSAISKTINMPKGSTKKDVSRAYLMAWEQGCKGVTVYVDGSRDGVLTTGEKKGEDNTGTVGSGDSVSCDLPVPFKLELPDKLEATRYRFTDHNREKVYFTVCTMDDTPVEVFCKMPTDSAESYWSVITRLLSLAMRYNVPLEDIIKQLRKGSRSVADSASKVARVLEEYLPEPEDTFLDEYNKVDNRKSCPECGGYILIYESGCCRCNDCGWSKCS